MPAVQLAARDDKARRAVVQALPQSAVPFFREYLRGRDENAKIWPGSWKHEPIKMLHIDLAVADIPYSVDGPDGPLFADFHALRHTYIASLDVPGMTPKQAMQLARHKDPALTMNVYGRAQLRELSAAANLAFGGGILLSGGVAGACTKACTG